jgi:hypothetical protein
MSRRSPIPSPVCSCTYAGLRHGVPATCVLIPGMHRTIAFRMFEISTYVRNAGVTLEAGVRGVNGANWNGYRKRWEIALGLRGSSGEEACGRGTEMPFGGVCHCGQGQRRTRRHVAGDRRPCSGPGRGDGGLVVGTDSGTSRAGIRWGRRDEGRPAQAAPRGALPLSGLGRVDLPIARRISIVRRGLFRLSGGGLGDRRIHSNSRLVYMSTVMVIEE